MNDKYTYICRVSILTIAAAAIASAQTMPRPDQLRNIEQVRICHACGDDRPGTLILQSQLQNGRTIEIPAAPDNPADRGKPTVCLVRFARERNAIAELVRLQAADETRVSLAPVAPPHNVKQSACYSQMALIALLNDPAWLGWWLSHGGLPIVPLRSPAMEKLIFDQLTHPFPFPPAPR